MENTNHLRVLIVEDELHNSRMLSDMVGKLRPAWEIVDIVESVTDTVEWLQENDHPDVILLDIQLSDGISFSIFEQIEINLSTKVIFTTAYDEYAIQAFKVNSVDYLLKPIKERELQTAFEKLERLQETQIQDENKFYSEPSKLKQLISSIMTGKKEYRKRFLISGVKSFYSVDISEVAYIQSVNKITMLITKDGKEHILDYSLEQLESELDPEVFFRANRQYIVHFDAVNKLSSESGGKLRLEVNPSSGSDIIISRLKATEFKHWLGK